MRPATTPRPVSSIRLLVVDERRAVRAGDLASLFEPGDLLVVNDAATVPASLHAHTPRGARIELRLAANLEGAAHWTAALLGVGDHRMRTEDRPPPPRVAPGERLIVDGDEGLVAVVTRNHALSPRLVDVRLELPRRRDPREDAVWAALYRAGKPVQYAHVPEALELWDVQNAWAARPWAVEMPSAGRALRMSALASLRARGVEVAFVTHAAGLSATGDPAIDAALPLPERFEVPEATVAAIERAACVVAVGTSVVRALEGAALASGGVLSATSGITDLRLGAGFPRRVVDAVLTGVHEVDTSHHALLAAFASPEALARAIRATVEEGFFAHEFGDLWLVWGQARESTGSRRDPSQRSGRHGRRRSREEAIVC
jgi:S-adenosylmethionine:tRNA ribosyltransferase-isomerase